MMIQSTDTIKITEYTEGLAAGIAKMWNLSRDSWGGDTSVMTEEQVRTKEANNGNIALYLAMDGEEVVGYCGLSEYKEDTGSLYIPLLNVRPDYHGRKIGKLLVLKALQKTVELGWPRLDLYTWPGNVKAVPLYKKCGFFWEDRDDTTHLMNFIPTVQQTPLLKSLLKDFDWYKDNVREIEVKPDGVKENGFTFYEYEWKNEQTSARVRFEKTGRGISLIETENYFLELSMISHETIEYETGNFELKFVNKTGKPVSFRAKGDNQGRIEATFDYEMLVENEAAIAEQLIVHGGEEPSVWKTHPSLAVKVWIDGEECELCLGLLPKQPAKITGGAKGNLRFLNQEAELELEVENSLKEDAVFHLSFQEDEHVSLNQSDYDIKLHKNERKLIKVPFIVKKYGFYQPEIKILARKNDGNELTFKSKAVGVPLKNFGQKFGGESKEYWSICNGICQANIRKLDYKITAGRNGNVNQHFAFFVPKLGRPYSTEFSKAKPESVEWFTDDSAITFKLVFRSKDFPGILVSMYTSLYGEGIVKTWAELNNEGETLFDNLSFNQPLYHEKHHTYFPLENEVVEFSSVKNLEFGEISASSLTENWYFSKHEGEPIGFCWPKKAKANPDGWQFYYENEVGCLKPGERVKLEPAYLSVGAFQSWEELQAFANMATQKENKIVQNEKAFIVNGGNPVAAGLEKVQVTLKTHRSSYLDGTIGLFLNDDKKQSAILEQKEEMKEYSANLPIAGAIPLSIVKADIKMDSERKQLSDLLLVPSGDVRTFTEKQGGKTVYMMDNGVIRLKAAPSFYPGLFSLAYQEREWLDTSFPEKAAKGWWNPWAGGMKTVPSKMSVFSLLKEETSAEFTSLKDSHGNEWAALALQTKVTHHSLWKGLDYTQYFALLPGVPVIAHWVKVADSGGNTFINEKWITDLFLSGVSLTDLTLTVLDKGTESNYQAGIEEQSFTMEDGAYISNCHGHGKMYVAGSKDREFLGAYMNKEAFQIISERKAALLAKPGYILFDERSIRITSLKSLHNLEFH
ncbi:GNAT family N-acetyltransferase [Cytobacillus oceanisediminis]|uniref:GNAT family N-acetyltransferase n=1 Tax=Cytobacillus oceanisediminis TaxID=665099 RepID=UPI003736AABF